LSGFFGGGGVGLGHFIHLGNGHIHLLDSAALFFGGRCDFDDELDHLAGFIYDLMEATFDLCGDDNAGVALLKGVVDFA